MPFLKYSKISAVTLTAIVSVSMGLTGCTATNNATNTSNAAGEVTGALNVKPSNIAQVVGTRYNTRTQSVTLYIRQTQGTSTKHVTDASLGDLATGPENKILAGSDEALINYATARYASKHIHQIVVVDLSAAGNRTQSRTVAVPTHLKSPGALTQVSPVPSGTTVSPSVNPSSPAGHLSSSIRTSSDDSSSVPTMSTMSEDASPAFAAARLVSSIPIPPPGVRIDYNISPIAPTSASYQTKFQAIMSVATSKLGTPYIWGHNEDRGQYGFDCSNFTEYVFHHALGYLFTTASRGQNLYVGVPVPITQMRPGDLMIFDNGGHVGIYAGNGQAIQEGGGLAKVGYLNVGPGSYWNRHTTAVKRMF